jgi:hypothetical protein
MCKSLSVSNMRKFLTSRSLQTIGTDINYNILRIYSYSTASMCYRCWVYAGFHFTRTCWFFFYICACVYMWIWIYMCVGMFSSTLLHHVPWEGTEQGSFQKSLDFSGSDISSSLNQIRYFVPSHPCEEWFLQRTGTNVSMRLNKWTSKETETMNANWADSQSLLGISVCSTLFDLVLDLHFSI